MYLRLYLRTNEGTFEGICLNYYGYEGTNEGTPQKLP